MAASSALASPGACRTKPNHSRDEGGMKLRSTYHGVLEPTGLNHVLGGICHPMSQREDMLVSLELCSLVTLEDKENDHREREKMYKAPKKELQHGVLSRRSCRAECLHLLYLLEPDAGKMAQVCQK